jgi:hypothetical protein
MGRLSERHTKHTATPARYYKARLTWNPAHEWEIALKEGTDAPERRRARCAFQPVDRAVGRQAQEHPPDDLVVGVGHGHVLADRADIAGAAKDIVCHQPVEAEDGDGREVETVEGAAVCPAGARVLREGRLEHGARESAELQRLQTAELRQLGAEPAPLRLPVPARQPGGLEPEGYMFHGDGHDRLSSSAYLLLRSARTTRDGWRERVDITNVSPAGGVTKPREVLERDESLLLHARRGSMSRA